MPDREKVIKALECRKNADKRCGNPCEDTGLCHYATAVRGLDGEIYKPFICDRERICEDALALLKEQESVIEALKSDLDETLKVLGEQPEIVRCEDCKHWIPGYITEQDDFIPPKCGKYQQMVGHSADDYCSLAEKQEGR